jgi:hypothetical protein
MKAFLDGAELKLTSPTLRVALDMARADAEASRRIIVEATINGEPCRNDWLESPPETEMLDAEVRFITAEPTSLVSTTFSELADVLVSAKAAQIEVCEALRTGRYDEAFTQLEEIVGVWEMVRRGVEEGTRLVGLPLEHFLVSAGTTPNGERDTRVELLTGHVGRLVDLLSDLKAAVQSRDWSGLADLLGHDLVDAADAWRRILKDMSATVLKTR